MRNQPKNEEIKTKILTHHQTHKTKASNGRSEKASRDRDLGKRETTSEQRGVQRGQRANDSEGNEDSDLTTTAVRRGLRLGI